MAFQSVSSEGDELRDGGEFLSYNERAIGLGDGLRGKGHCR